MAFKYHVPLIVEYNGSEVWVSQNWGNGLRFKKLAQMAENVMLQSADLVVTVSKVLKEELVGRGIPSNKIVYYPNCIDPMVFNPTRFTKDEKYKKAFNKRNTIKVAQNKIYISKSTKIKNNDEIAFFPPVTGG